MDSMDFLILGAKMLSHLISGGGGFIEFSV